MQKLKDQLLEEDKKLQEKAAKYKEMNPQEFQALKDKFEQ